MKTSVTLALAFVVVALGAFIFFYERHTVGTSEVARREGRLLEVFDRGKVSRVEIHHQGRTIVIARVDGDDADFRIESPIRTHADDDAVEALLGALDWAVPFRTIDEVSSDDRAGFGLDEPFASVTITVGGKPIDLVVGKEAPGGEGRYAAGRRKDRVFVISSDVVEALTHDLDHFRGKLLFPESFVKVGRVEREGEGDAFVLVDQGGVSRLESPIPMTANDARVEAFLRGLQELTAARFLREGDVEPSLLGSPRLRVRVEADGGTHELLIFGECPGTPGQAIARASGGSLVCVNEASLDPLTIDRDEIREMRLASARDFDVERFELSSGDHRIEISLADDARYELFVGGKSVASGEADESAFTDWLRSMRRTVARQAQPLPEKDRARYGLDRPEGTLRMVERGPLKRATVLHLGKGAVASLFARREGDDILLVFPDDAIDLLRPNAFRVRSRSILDAELHQVVSIHVTTKGSERAEIDPSSRSELTARIVALEAVRYDADKAEPRHGLAEPRAQIEIVIAPEDDHGHAHGPDDDEHVAHRLLLGAAAEDGVYARLDDDPMVFVVTNALFEAATQAP